MHLFKVKPPGGMESISAAVRSKRKSETEISVGPPIPKVEEGKGVIHNRRRGHKGGNLGHPRIHGRLCFKHG